MYISTNHNSNVKFNGGIQRTGKEIAANISSVPKFSVANSLGEVFRFSRRSAIDYLCVPLYPLVFGFKGQKDKKELHPKTAIGMGTIIGGLSVFSNITDAAGMNPHLSESKISLKREFIKDFKTNDSINLKNTTISKLITGKQKALLKDAAVRFPATALVFTGLCLGAEALYNKFWVTRQKQS